MAKSQKYPRPPATDDNSFNRASQFYCNGDFTKAQKECESILANDKKNAKALTLLGQIEFRTQSYKRALEYYGKALSIDPNSGITLNAVGRVFESLGNYLKALDYYQKAASQNPGTPEILVNMGNTSAALNHNDNAISYYKQALRLRPNYAEVHSNLGNLYFQKKGDIGKAIKHCQKAIQINPNLAEAHNNLGNALEHNGRLDKAIQCYRKAIKLKPDYSCAHSNLLLGIHYSDRIPPDQVFKEHKNYATDHCKHFTQATHEEHDASINRTLRIGYISPDFRGHPVAWFIKSVITEHDRSQFTIFCYSDVITPDAWTEKFKQLSDSFRSVKGLSHAEVASLIKKDKIDLLVDLTGHTANNRIPMLAMKPAPIQMTYLGYPGTTGLDSVDYRLTDHFADPEGMTEKYHTEKLIRMPRSFLCYTPPEYCPGIKEPPANGKGKITFGSFNNRSKITETVIETWSEILKNIPDSTLFLKAKSLADVDTQKLMTRLFKRHKISHKRLHYSGFLTDAKDHMLLYNQVDIALDTFPYNGTTTTCEALWMGVPVITLEGETHASRVGTSILSNTGLEGLIAKDRNDYIKKACTLAQTPDRLTRLKSGLRKQVEASGFIDAKRFTRELEQKFSTAWQGWCISRQSIDNKKVTLEHKRPIELLTQGEVHFHKGEMELAEKHFLIAARKDPNLVEAYNNLGVLYEQLGDWEKSLVHFKKALTLDPTNQDAIANLQQMSAILADNVQANNSKEPKTGISPASPENKTATKPKLLTSLFISKPSPGKSQGGLYLVDLEKKAWEQVLDLNQIPMSPPKKNHDRRISGIALHTDQICIIAGDELFIYDKNFKLLETHKNHYLKDCPGLFTSGNRLFMTSTGFDSILVFDFSSSKFIEGYHVKYSKTANRINLLPFDPESDKGPPQENTIALNAVCIYNNLLYFSCQKLDRLFCVQENGAMHGAAVIPLGTHTARPYKQGFLIASANGQSVDHLDFKGNTIASLNLPHHDKTDHRATPVSKFSEGLCVTDNDSIIAVTSPSTVLSYKSRANEPDRIVPLNIDTASTINALAVWTL
jgi:predicted O-linked N-acetylglucosamine transferase (SPINDLY family)